ncbi:MAG: translation initiation factor IF-2 [Desulfobacteria bacterium]
MVRVYELAQELGMTNNEFIDELEKLGIEAKNHMSSIEEEKVEVIKNRLAGVKARELIEKRVKPTVIRRRMKKIEPDIETLDAGPVKAELPKVEEPLPQVAPPSTAPEEIVEKREEPVEGKAIEPGKVVPEPVSIETELLGRKKDLKRLAEIEEDEDQARVKPGKKITKKEAEDPTKLKPSKRKVIYKKKEDHAPKDLYEKEDVLEPSRGPAVKKGPHKRIKKKTEITIPKAIKRKIRILETITVNELAKKMGIKVGNVIKKLLDLGVVATINQPLDIDTASLIASEFSYAVESIPIDEDILEKEKDAPEELVHRPPVVTVMGHVDHGKTSLLDAIRETNVMGKEAGGITQHIGAYHVSLPKGDIVFLDTPGHEAFTAMRARGAQVTDIVVLVVAADDGVMSQTVEAINHAKAAGVTLMVAINKIDKPNADIEKVKRNLMEYGLVPEELGGDTVFVEVSAKKKLGINDILELILLQAELLELKANPNKAAKGVVIEAKLDKGRGPVATVLIKEGTLKVGDPFVVGVKFGKIRALINENGEKVTQVGPAMPIEIIGLSGVPEAGDSFVVVDDEKKTRQVALFRQQKKRESELVKTSKIALENLYDKIQEGYVKELNIIVKADVQGSIEALLKALNELSTDAVKLHVIHASVGDIGESDVMLASASNAITIGFNVKSDTKVQQIAEQEKVSIRFYSIIYNAISDMKKAMEGLLDPILEEKTLGRAEVRSTFNISRTGTIAGSFVLNGKIVKGEHARLLRDDVVIHDGKIYSLKRFKDDVKEVESGYECGIGIENFNDLKVDDIIESYTYEKVLATL